MASDEIPGSPRKKIKLGEAESNDTEMDLMPQLLDVLNKNDAGTITCEHSDSAKDAPPPPLASMSSSHTDPQSTLPTTTHQADMDFLTGPTLSHAEQVNKEKARGITEFVNPELQGFTGILKKRYTDFVVNEILPDGKIVHLTSLAAPERNQPKNNRIKKSSPTSEHLDSLEKTSSPQEVPEDHAQLSKANDEVPAVEYMAPMIIDRDTDAETQTVTEQHEETSEVNEKVPVSDNVLSITIDNHLDTETHTAIEQHEEPSEMKEKVSVSDDMPLVEPDQKESQVILENEQTSKLSEPELAPHLVMTSKTSSSQSSSPTSSPLKGERTRQVYSLQLSDKGWVESDKPVKAEGNSPPRPASKPQTTYLPKPSTASQWKAFAKNGGEPSKAPNVAPKLISDEDKGKLLSYFSENVVDGIIALFDRILNSPHRPARDYGVVKSPVIDRSLRTKIHRDMRGIFQARLETTTDKDGVMIISAMPQTKNFHTGGSRSGQAGGKNTQSTSKPRGSGKSKWHELGGEELHFTLCKENKDTMECISYLAKKLRIAPKHFGFAGTKDRRGITTQRVSVFRQDIKTMIPVGNDLHHAEIGDYEYRSNPLKLGELMGNEFIITLRDCDFERENSDGLTRNEANAIVSKAFMNFVNQGFINYFGLQRFGTFATSTSEVGVNLLQGDFKGAIDCILQYTPESLAAAQSADPENSGVSKDDRSRAWAINTFQTSRNYHRVLQDVPKKFSAECSIIRYLGNQPQHRHDYYGAIMQIQRNLRLMYVHAYQSLVWNLAASKRWELYGDAVVAGDLVIDTERENKNSLANPEGSDEDGEPIVHPYLEDRAINPDEMLKRARVLSKEEAESGKYTIFDVVLPTPGFDIIYPGNEVAKFYEEFMASPAGGGLDPHNMVRSQKDFSLSGNYRELLARPLSVPSFKIKVYEDENHQFVKTDFDRLPKKGTESEPSNTDNQKLDEDSDDGEGVLLPVGDKKIAVIITLQLGFGQYATMALRELMKAGGVKTYKPDFSGGR